MRVYEYNAINDICTQMLNSARCTAQEQLLQMREIYLELMDTVSNIIDKNGEAVCGVSIEDILLEIEKELAVWQMGTVDKEKFIRLLCNLQRQFREDIQIKFRILFIAELGSKWDSMATVYETLKKRSDCQVDVVLEPIFREKTQPDGTKHIEMVYEDYLTPMGITHISYRDYDMEYIRPDITFYSQPYESVTIPMFYPKNMCKYTKLVYLPYFGMTTIDKEINHSFDSCFYSDTPRYAWKIACESEYMKKYYAAYSEGRGKNAIVSGIPKWDYPFKFDRQNTPCPKEWEEKIKGKKVFLWNSHFSTEYQGINIFSHGKEFLRIFTENPDIALIWRPHPMTEPVIKVYNSGFYEIYEELVETVMQSSNMVIDTYTSYDNAFMWSDALLSDYSSLVDQYIFMDKPYAFLFPGTEEAIIKKYYTVDKLFDFSKVYIINTMEKVQEFIQAVLRDKDFNKQDRTYIKEQYYGMADGHIGERLAERIMEDFRQECIFDTTCLEKPEILVVGPEEDSKPCIKALQEQNIKFTRCLDIDDEAFSAEYAKNDRFAYIILTARKKAYIMYDILTRIYEVPKEKILCFWKMYHLSLPELVCDRIMMNPKVSSYEGIILGLSHTEVGIITDRLKKPFCNLAVSSQDFYYGLKTLEHCIEQYPQKLKNLKYAVIDLYDYKFFNYDCSLSTSIEPYLMYNGYNKDAHHFADNKNYNVDFETLKNHIREEKFSGILQEHIGLWNDLFANAEKYTDYEGFGANFDISSRLRVVTQNDVDTFLYKSGSSVNVFPETINENVYHLVSIFEKLKSINKDIKIYTIIVPKFIDTEVKDAEYMVKFIDYWEAIIKKLSDIYDFTMLDFAKDSDLATKKSFYYDAAHLNYYGACWLTDRLNEIIFAE